MKLSLITPTTSARLAFLPLSIDALRQQDIDKNGIELIIVTEDSEIEAACGVLVPPEITLHIVTCKRGLTVGEKRNIACEHAHSPWISFWDDDDWHHPQRLSRTLSCCTESADIVGSQTMLIHELIGRRRTMQYKYTQRVEQDPAKFFVGGTLTFRKSCWEEVPFIDRVGEEAWFQFALERRGKRLVEFSDDPRMYVAMMHGANTGNTQIPHGDPTWLPWNEDLFALMGDSLRWYESVVALRHNRREEEK
jgi:glycosyltransferase involved in cell wall biosynthesis